MGDDNVKNTPENVPAVFTLEEFFLNASPNEVVTISDLWKSKTRAAGYRDERTILLPKLLSLPCGHCGGDRYFGPTASKEFYDHATVYEFVHYKCNNCGKRFKTYSLWMTRDENPPTGSAMKYGEHPPFGPPIPPDVEKMLGDDAPLFRKAIDAESKGLGIGAFAYYRRIVENQRTRIFEQVIKVAERLQALPEIIDQLKTAQNERQFTRSVDAIKPGPLTAIYIDGHNPLTLLHDAISEGLHAQSDAENLSSAQTIRVILADLAKRIDQALADHDEVKGAVAKLLKAKAVRSGSAKSGVEIKKPHSDNAE